VIDSSYCFSHPFFSLSPPSHSQQKFPKTCRPVSFLLHVLPFPPFLFSPPFSSASCLLVPENFLPYITFSLPPLPFYLVLAALSLLSYHSCLILSALSFLSYHSTPALFASFFLPYHSCPFLHVLYFTSVFSFLPYHFCSILSALSFLPYHSYPILSALSSLLRTPLLSFLPHPSYLNLTTLSYLPDTVVSIQSSLPYTCCHKTLSEVSIPYLLSI